MLVLIFVPNKMVNDEKLDMMSGCEDLQLVTGVGLKKYNRLITTFYLLLKGRF